MNANSDSVSFSRWPDLPADILSSLSTRIDPVIGILRLRSVCRSWRSSLSLIPSSPHFPLSLPLSLSLNLRSLFLLTPPPFPTPSSPFLLKLHQNPNPNSTFTLFNPLSNLKPYKPTSAISLLNYGVSTVCHSYFVENAYSRVSELGQIVMRKVVVVKGFFERGDFVVLGLTEIGDLLIWRFGDEDWIGIEANGRLFDDVISYKGKFYATADKRGRLVMIDSRLKPVDLVHSLMYGCGNCTHLVESDGDLYLVDRVRLSYEVVKIEVFKLDEKCRFWDYEMNLNDNVFFVGDDVNFSVSRKDYVGGVRNCVYFINKCDDEERDFTAVFDMKLGAICPMLDFKELSALYWPPSSWFGDLKAADYSSSKSASS